MEKIAPMHGVLEPQHPYLGVPGASSAKSLRGVDLSGIGKVYILHEPAGYTRVR